MNRKLVVIVACGIAVASALITSVVTAPDGTAAWDRAYVVLAGGVLVATAYYAFQTNDTVEEMRAARRVVVIPRLILDMDSVGGRVGFIVLTNSGLGPAFDVRVNIDFGPGNASIEWGTPLLAVGQRRRFREPSRVDNLDAFTATHGRVVLKGTCHNALGETVRVSDDFDAAAWWSLLVASGQMVRNEAPDPVAVELEQVHAAITAGFSAMRQQVIRAPRVGLLRRLFPR